MRSLLVQAGDIAERYGLGGYDAVHLASALTVPDRYLLMVAWDRRLRAATEQAGLALAPLQT